MSSLLFRQESIESGRQRLTGTVIAAVPPRSRHYTLFALFSVLLFIVVLTVGNYARRAQVSGVIAYSEGIVRVAAPANAEIEEIHVREGQKVRRGMPLVTVSLTHGTAAGSAGIDAQLAELDRQMSELRKQKNLTIGLASSEQSSLGAQRSSAQQTIASLEKQKDILAKQIRLDESQQGRIRRLLAQGVGTKVELEEAERSVLASRLNLESTVEKIIDKREQLATLTAARSMRGMNGVQSESELDGRIAAIAQERATLLRQDRLVLQAPIDGEIGDIAMNVGQSTSSNGSIVSVIPKKSKLEVQLLAPSSAVGFVKPGQNVKLKFDAFPYEKYGVSQGIVTWVSTVPTDSPVVIGKPASPEPVFRVRVSIDSKGFDKKLPKGQLRAGMTLSANLILEERSLWEAFLGPIFKAVGS